MKPTALERAYTLLLRLYPPSFRREHQREMRQFVLVALARERTHTVVGRLALDLARTVPREWRHAWFRRRRRSASASAVRLGSTPMTHISRDLRYAIRLFVKHPTFTITAILTLALGIGANTAMFSVVYSVLVRPLPFAESGRLVRVFENVAAPDGSTRRMSAVTVSEVPAFRSELKLLSDVGLQLPAIRTVTGVGDPVRLVGARVSPSVFSMLQATPLVGRTFRPQEDVPGADAVVILSHATWQRLFAGNPNVEGQTIALDGRAHVIVGVMNRDFAFPDTRNEFWIPFAAPPTDTRRLPIIARLQEGASIEAATAEVSAVVPHLRGESDITAGTRAHAGPRFEVVSLLDLTVAPVRPALLIFAGAVAFVLLIACVNVANLVLVRSAARHHEIAVRLALGAARGRLVQQALTESLMLSLAGGLLGVALAFGGVQLLRTLGASLPRVDLGSTSSLPRLEEIGVDSAALIFALVISVLTAVAFGLGPAVRVSGLQQTRVLREGAGAPASGFNPFRGQRLHGLLVIAEVALAMMLLMGGGLLMHSFVKLSRVDLGYDPRDVVSFQLALPDTRSDAQLRQLADNLSERLRTLPQVRGVGYVEALPNTLVSGRRVPLRTTPSLPTPLPRPSGPSFTPDLPDTRLVSRDFLDAMGMRLIAGRLFAERDGAAQPQVMLINEALARSGFVGENPIGRQFYALGSEPWEIIGIVADARQMNPAQRADPQIFIDFRQVPDSQRLSGVGLYFAVRTDGEAPAVVSSLRAMARQLDREAIVENIAPMSHLVWNSIGRPRLYAAMLGIFSGIALLMAAVGIYGVMAHAVTRRTREIGIRMALGAHRSSVIGLVLRQSLVLTLVGIGLGLLGGIMVTRTLGQLLLGLTALDPLTFVVVSTFFAAVAMLAAFVPARRAARIDPMVALHYE